MKEIMLNYTQYNLWANTKITALLKENSFLLDKEVKSSFPSLRKTIYHICAAEEVWQKRLHGESPASLPQPGNDFAEFEKQLLACDQSFVDSVKNKDENYLHAICSYKDTKGNPYTSLHWQMIMHCMNHSTFHRGQLITMLREFDITTIPITDMIAYFREKNK